MMQRRKFLTVLGGAAGAWLLPAFAGPRERVRRIGALMNLAATDPESQDRVGAFVQRLGELGWTIGRNLRVEFRWPAGNEDLARRYAAELVELAPEAILAASGAMVMPLLQATRSIPIVFAQTPDPVGAGFVASLAHPGGNATGFTQLEFGLSAKWLELLKQIAPRVTRVAVLRDAMFPSGVAQFAAVQTAATSLGVELTAVGVRDANEIEQDIRAFARGPNDAMIVTASALSAVHREVIIALAARHRLPAIYPFRYFVTGGGLISYGADPIDQYRNAAGYIDRILKGEKAADLPVQAPVKFQTVLNANTAKALGLEVPTEILVRADEVIE
jgi:putative tryptophan/tyrosine transport system substrate-binding protein